MKKKFNFVKEFKINKRLISANNVPYIVAEMSANHCGSLRKAFKIISSAKKNGADAIKIQTYNADSMTIKSKKGQFYIKKGLWKNKNLYNLYKKASTPLNWIKPLFQEAKKNNITVFSTPFDLKGLEELEKFNPPAYKIASFEIVDLEFLKNVSMTKKPIILSTGMASFKEIEEALTVIYKESSKKVILLHCISAYPTGVEEANLSRIIELKKRYNVLVGLSDHCLNNITSIVGSTLGACLIEKHFILSRKDKSPDSAFSIEPKELKDLSLNINLVNKSMRKKDIKNKSPEMENKIFRRSIYIVKDIKENEILSNDNLKSIRPGFGLKPKFINKVLGRRIRQKYLKGTPLSWNMLK